MNARKNIARLTSLALTSMALLLAPQQTLAARQPQTAKQAAKQQPAKPQALKAPADAPEAQILKYNNPDVTMNLGVGLWGIPVPCDMDGDGKKDLMACCPDTPYKGVYYFHNIGTADKPLFDKSVRLTDKKPDKNIRYSEYAGKSYVYVPAGELNGFFKNPECKAAPVTYENPLPQYNKTRTNMWNVVDWDGDGDLDYIVGIDSWDEYGWDNAYDAKGNWTNGPLRGYVYLIENQNGKYVNVGRVQAAGKDMETYGAPMPCIADFDGDGDLDIICGEFLDRLTWFENIGTREKPVFAAGRRLLDTANKELRFHVEMIVPVATDFDGDGKTDLLVGDEDGTVAFVRNSGKVVKNMPLFDPWYTLQQKADDLKYGALSTPCAVDWDGDGLQDMICGNSAGDICFIKNLGGGMNPIWDTPKPIKVNGKPFRIMAGNNGSIQGPAECKWGYTVLDVADWDGDGRKDIIFNSIWGKIQWLRNLGAKDGLSFAPAQPIRTEDTSVKPAWNWWNPAAGELVTQWRTTPVVIDWDGDGILDIVMLDSEGYLAFYQGVGKGKAHKVKQPQRKFYGFNCSLYSNRNGVENKECGLLRLNALEAGQSGRRKICFVDWNNDGRKDLMVDGKFGAVWFSQMPSKDGNYYFKFEDHISATRLEGHTTCPTPVDWDNNGIYDIVCGAEDGHFYRIDNPCTIVPDEIIKLYPDLNVISTERIDERGYIFDINDPELLVFRPTKGKSKAAVLIVPGGGYEKVCITREGYATAKLLAANGITSFILKYRLPDGNPDIILNDAEQAMRIIRGRAAQYGINPARIGVFGCSAGGHYCANLLTHYSCPETRPDYGILIYPVISSKYDNAGTHARLLGDKLGTPEAARWDLETQIRPDMPPMMIIQCSDDSAVLPAQVFEFYHNAIKAGVSVQLHMFPKGRHGFWMRKNFAYSNQCYPVMVNWIKTTNK